MAGYQDQCPAILTKQSCLERIFVCGHFVLATCISNHQNKHMLDNNSKSSVVADWQILKRKLGEEVVGRRGANFQQNCIDGFDSDVIKL